MALCVYWYLIETLGVALPSHKSRITRPNTQACEMKGIVAQPVECFVLWYKQV
jgi:hypothetical protein